MAKRKNKGEVAQNTATENTVTENTAATEPKASKSIVPLKFKERYKANDGNCGDGMASAFDAAVKDGKGKTDPELLAKVAAANGIDLAGRWGKLNLGQQRMNLGNVLRTRARKGETVTIGETVFNENSAAA